MNKLVGSGIRTRSNREELNPFLVDVYMPTAWKGTWKQTALHALEMVAGIALILLIVTRM